MFTAGVVSLYPVAGSWIRGDELTAFVRVSRLLAVDILNNLSYQQLNDTNGIHALKLVCICCIMSHPSNIY